MNFTQPIAQRKHANRSRSIRGARRGGFTLVELLVTLPIFLIILFIAATTMSNVQMTVRASTAITDVMTQDRTLEHFLRNDLFRITRDGFMVIKSRRFTDAVGQIHDVDQFMFFATGPWSSQQINQNFGRHIIGNVARIWYGHPSQDLSDNPPSTEAIQWPLARHALILSMLGTQQYAPLSIWQKTPLNTGLWDVAYGTDMTAIRECVRVSSAIPPKLNSAQWHLREANSRMAEACFRMRGKKTVDLPQANLNLSNELMLAGSILTPNCTDFKVEFSGDYYPRGGIGDGRIDSVDGDGGNDGDANDPIYWYGLNSPTDIDEIDYFNQPDEYIAVFGFDQSKTPWPKLIRITVRLHDANGQLRKRFLDEGEGVDGQLFQVVLHVPV